MMKMENTIMRFIMLMRWSNIELLDTLINKWPDNYFAVHLEKLDEILSRAYDELQLKNVPLLNKIEIFVEQKLINLRFFSNTPRNDDNFSGDLNIDTIGRIELMLNSISLLRKDYSKQEKVDGKFLYVAKSIAQNIHVLKQKLKSTYEILPWEEMEFCLVIFVSSHIKSHEMNFIFRATLNKSKMLKHLENFAKKLKEQKENIKEKLEEQKDKKNKKKNKNIKGTTSKPFNFSRLQRADVVAGIILNYPPFEELYNDYRQVRDVYSLEKINDSIKLALSADPKETEGRLTITRSLQVIGENVKNTLASPKLSDTTSALFLLSLSENTRQIVANLRDSLSHGDSLSKRMEIEENPDINFFNNIKSDTKKVGDVINDILLNNKIETIRRLLKIIDENFDDITEIAEVLSTVELKETFLSTFKMLEHEKLENLLKDLSNIITEKTNYEERLLKEIDGIINSVRIREKNNTTHYNIGFIVLQNFTLNLTDEEYKIIKSCITNLLLYFTSKVEPNDIKKIADLLLKMYGSVKSRMQKDKLDDIAQLLYKFYCIVEFEIGDIKWIEELREELKKAEKSTQKQRKTFNVSEEKCNNNDQLTPKLSKLKTILSDYTSESGPLIIEKLLDYKKDSKIQAVVEMLVLDIMSILDSSKLENNLLLLDDHTPLLTGRCLRNHLAHDNALFDVLSSDPSIAVILNAEKLTEENLINGKKIGKVIDDDILKLEAKYKQGLDTITNQEKMFVALESLEEGKMEKLQECVKNGADINGISINCWTTLHFAAKGGSLEVVKFIHDQNVNVNFTDKRGQTPLHIAAAYGRQDIVEYFINNAALCVDVRNCIDGRTPLHVAAQNGHKDTVDVLLKNKAIAGYDKHGVSPLHYAIRNDHMDIVKILLEKDVSVDINNTIGFCTPLHEASERGNLELVNILLRNKAEVNARDYYDYMPLHVAADKGYEEFVKALILKGADVNARSMQGCSALYIAVQSGYENVTKILLQYGANVDAAVESNRRTPLHCAVQKGYMGIVKTLLINKANANAVTVEGVTALNIAAHNGHLDITAALLEHDGVDIHAKDEHNGRPLHYAAINGHKEVSELLIQKIGDINANNNYYLTILHAAAAHAHKDVVTLLIENKAGVNVRKADGRTPLHVAAGNGSVDIIDLLIKNNADVNAKDNNDETPLHLAAVCGNGNAVDFLIKKEADVNAACSKGPPLVHAVKKGHIEVVKILVRNDADINIMKKGPLFCAVVSNRNNIVEFLIAKGAKVNAENGEALFAAIFLGFTDIVTTLLKNKASVSVRDCDDETPLHIAARLGHKKIVKALMSHEADVEPNNTINAVTPLCLAAQGGHEVVVTLLIAGGANVNARYTNGTTPLCLAAIGGHEIVVTLLIAGGANVNARSIDGMTPLHLAAVKGHTNVVKVLLDNQANNVKDNKDRTPIQCAVAVGHLKVVVMLLEVNKEIIMNTKYAYDITLLHMASRGSNLELVKYLVDEGFDMNAKDLLDGSKPIHYAAMVGNKDTLNYFFSKGVSNDTDVSEKILQYYVKQNRNSEVVKYLIAQGANVNAKLDQGLTAMHFAAKFGFTDVIEVLLQYGAIYNAIDESYRTPLSMAKNIDVINLFESTDKLFVAVKHNTPLEVQNYINSGACVNAKEVEGVTPLHYAAWKGYEEVVNVLLKNNANPNAVDNIGLTPLHLAAIFGHLKIIKALLSNHAVYNPISEGQGLTVLDGQTPSDFSGDEGITILFKLVNKAFQDIKNDKSQVVDYLNKITDIDTLKAVMCACDRENRTLVVAAVHSNFAHVDQLKEILLQGHLSVHITTAVELLEQGNLETALEIFENAWEKSKEILGSDHPGTLNIQTHIATVLCEQGAYPKALNILNDIFKKQEKMLGMNDKDTLRTRSTIAIVLKEQENYEEAFIIYQEVYQKQKEILGLDHCDTLCTQINMPIVLAKLGKYEEALHMIQSVLKKKEAKMGSDHIETMRAQHNLAVVLANQGEFEEALEIFKKVHEKRKKVLGVSNLNTLRTLFNIAAIFSEQHKTSEALNVFEEVFKSRDKVLGPNHPHTLKTRHAMANVLFIQNNSISAYKSYKEVLDQMKIVYGPSHRYALDILERMEEIKRGFEILDVDISKVVDNLQNDINTAARNGDIQIVQRLLEDGADPNEKDIDGRTPLYCAVSYGHLSVMNILLQNRADVARTTDKVNTTLLHTATAKDCKEIVDILLQHVSLDKLNEFINAKTTVNGDTSLHIAVNNGALHIIKSLLKRGAIYNIKNNKGKTPFDLSQDQYEHNFLKLVEELFEDAKSGNDQIIGKLKPLTPDDFKAVTNARNNEGNTLLQVARSNKHKIVANKLLEMQKKVRSK